MAIEFDIALHRGRFDGAYRAELDRGITGVFGRSGSGKTTLLHLICGLLRPDRGRMVIDGEVLFDSVERRFVPPERRRMGVVFQDGRLFPHLSVKKNLLFGVPRYHPAPRFEKVVDLLDLEPLLGERPGRLSGGQRQRVALGRAIIQSPRLLLLDEPFTGIDAELRYHILPYIRRIHTVFRVPMLVVSHDLPDILRLTESLLIVRDGRVAATGSIFDLVSEREIYPLLRRSRLINRLETTFEAVQRRAPREGPNDPAKPPARGLLQRALNRA